MTLKQLEKEIEKQCKRVTEIQLNEPQDYRNIQLLGISDFLYALKTAIKTDDITEIDHNITQTIHRDLINIRKLETLNK